MKHQIRSAALLVSLVTGVGCDYVDYYPHHEQPTQNSDLRKSGPGTYGGNNSTYPVGTPGTGTPIPAASAPSVNASGAGTVSDTGSYSGASTGGASSASPPAGSMDGTTHTGAAGGH